jgi:ribonuclease Z
VLFLGTISMKPTMYRAASAVYLFVKGKGILLDCAEGSYGQLLDHFQSTAEAEGAIERLRVVFITHIHGDHQLGIIKILAERDRLLRRIYEGAEEKKSIDPN